MTKPLSRRYVTWEQFQKLMDRIGPNFDIVPGGAAIYNVVRDGFHEAIIVAADDPRCGTHEVFEDADYARGKHAS